MRLAARCVLRVLLSFTLIVCGMLPLGTVSAEESKMISTDRREFARRLFEQGERAYEARDFVQAAKSFEEAYRLEPHHAPLWNAARSWDRAGEQTRAANGYARYLHAAPADAPDRDEATQALAVLASKLGRIEVYAADVELVRVDDELLQGNSVYVHPGMHVIEGRRGSTLLRRTEMVEAGSVRSVALIDEPPPMEVAIRVPAPQQNALSTSMQSQVGRGKDPAAANQSRKWLAPVAIAAGGATVVTGALVLWSGLDTLSARKDFDSAPTEDKLAAGKDKQFRTNVLLGSMLGSGVIAGALASWWLMSEPSRNSAITISPPVAGMPLEVVWVGSF